MPLKQGNQFTCFSAQRYQNLVEISHISDKGTLQIICQSNDDPSFLETITSDHIYKYEAGTVFLAHNKNFDFQNYLDLVYSYLLDPRCQSPIGFSFSYQYLHKFNKNNVLASDTLKHIINLLKNNNTNVKDLLLDFSDNSLNEEAINELRSLLILNKPDCPTLTIEVSVDLLSYTEFTKLLNLFRKYLPIHKLWINFNFPENKEKRYEKRYEKRKQRLDSVHAEMIQLIQSGSQQNITNNNLELMSTDVIIHHSPIKSPSPSSHVDEVNHQEIITQTDTLLQGGLAAKYLNVDRLPRLNRVAFEAATNTTHNNVIPFTLVHDLETGIPVHQLEPIELQLDESHFRYYSARQHLPASHESLVGVMAGRGHRASIPTEVGSDTRVILTITAQQLEHFFLPQFQVFWVRSATDLASRKALTNATVLIQDSKKMCQFDNEGKRREIVFHADEQSDALFDIGNQFGNAFNITTALSKEQWAKLQHIIKANSDANPLQTLVLPKDTDLLVIEQLKSSVYGTYDANTINARRAAFLIFSSARDSQRVMMLDDNIEQWVSNDLIKNIDDIWAFWSYKYQGNQVLTSVITQKPIQMAARDKNRLGSKCFIIDMPLLDSLFFDVKRAERPFILFLPAYAGTLFGEDYYMQAMIHQGALYHNKTMNATITGTVFFDYMVLMLKRHKKYTNMAKKSVTKADAWACINEHIWLEPINQLANLPSFVDIIRERTQGAIGNLQQVLNENWQVYNHTENTIRSLDIQAYQEKFNSQSHAPRSSLKPRTSPIPTLKKLYETIQQGFLKKDELAGQKKYALYDHQDKVIQLWLEQHNQLNFKEPVLHAYNLATGTGKTRIQAIILYLALFHLQIWGASQQSLAVITPTQNLVKQTANAFREIFSLCNEVSGERIDSKCITKVMSERGSVSQKIVQMNEKHNNHVFIYCAASFKQQAQENPETLHTIDIIFADEYHTYNSLTTWIAQLNGYDIQLTNSDDIKKKTNSYLLNLTTQLVHFINRDGEKKEFPFKVNQIYDTRQLEVLKQIESSTVQTKKAVSIKANEELATTFHHCILKANEFPQISANDQPVYLIDKIATQDVVLCDRPPQKAPLVTTTFICLYPLSVYQSNPYGLIEPVVSPQKMRLWLDQHDLYTDHLLLVLTVIGYKLEEHPFLRFNDLFMKVYPNYLLLHDLIIQQGGYPLFNKEIEKPLSCFIISKIPSRLIYRNQKMTDTEISQGYYVNQLLKKIDTNNHLLNEATKELIAADANQLIKKKYAIYPLVKSPRQIPFFAFSATPPQNPLFEIKYTFSAQEAIDQKIITPYIIRKIKYDKKTPIELFLPHLLSTIHPNGMALKDAKGLMQFTKIKQVNDVADYLEEYYPDLPVFIIHSETINERENYLDSFKIAKKGIILTVNMLALGWDDPTL